MATEQLDFEMDWTDCQWAGCRWTKPGDYIFETTFDLSSSELGTFVLTGRLASDNTSEIFLNGVNTGQGASGGSTCCFDHFTTFQITSGLVVGLNHLDFVDNNADCGPQCFNPTGLRVEFGSVRCRSPRPWFR